MREWIPREVDKNSRNKGLMHCPEHDDLLVTITRIDTTLLNVDKRINGSIDDIKKHIEHGQAWRMGIIGVAAMVIIQTLVLSSMWGKLVRTVEVNTGRIDGLEDLHPRVAK
jgi:hypothetical protein